MAKFLDTTGVSDNLTKIIKNANDRLILISPYLKISDRLKDLIQDKNIFKIDIRIIYGKNELNPDQINWLKSMNYVKTSFCKNLHAKCYLNEKEALITSMNLHEFSQQNNEEMGIYVSKNDDGELYDEINHEAQRLIRNSDEIIVSVQKVIKSDINSNKSKGFCIRCKAQIKLNPDAPYCNECYKIWNEYKNEEYIEKYCMICGKNNDSTFLKPVCKECYKDNKKLFK